MTQKQRDKLDAMQNGMSLDASVVRKNGMPLAEITNGIFMQRVVRVNTLAWLVFRGGAFIAVYEADCVEITTGKVTVRV